MSRRPGFPVTLQLSGKRVLVVGSTDRARERASRSAEAGADVTRVNKSDYHTGLVHDAFVVFAHTDDTAFDAEVVRQARAAGCVCYAHDQPALSDFAMPAIVRRGPLKIAISTDAVAPALSRRLREHLEALFEAAADRVDAFIEHLAELREELPRKKRGKRLYREAGRLRIVGRVVVDDPE